MINSRTAEAGVFDKRVVHEVLQQVALAGLYRSGFFDKAAFYGGTCLRLFHGLGRFSEDLDFSLLRPDPTFDLTDYFDGIINEFAANGCKVEIRQKNKTHATSIESAFLKSDTALYSLETELQGKITIKIEVDTDPPGGFSTEALSLVAPFTFLTPCYTLPDLFAGKMHALLYRQWKSRVKGRDWYDFVWYVKKGIKLDLEHFALRVQQINPEVYKPITQQSFLTDLQSKIMNTDINTAKREVQPFLRDASVLNDWSQEFFLIQCNHIKFLS
jgi:predicted nucleotidyltransferase component of viral defense system